MNVFDTHGYLLLVDSCKNVLCSAYLPKAQPTVDGKEILYAYEAKNVKAHIQRNLDNGMYGDVSMGDNTFKSYLERSAFGYLYVINQAHTMMQVYFNQTLYLSIPRKIISAAEFLFEEFHTLFVQAAYDFIIGDLNADMGWQTLKKVFDKGKNLDIKGYLNFLQNKDPIAYVEEHPHEQPPEIHIKTSDGSVMPIYLAPVKDSPNSMWSYCTDLGNKDVPVFNVRINPMQVNVQSQEAYEKMCERVKEDVRLHHESTLFAVKQFMLADKILAQLESIMSKHLSYSKQVAEINALSDQFACQSVQKAVPSYGEFFRKQKVLIETAFKNAETDAFWKDTSGGIFRVAKIMSRLSRQTDDAPLNYIVLTFGSGEEMVTLEVKFTSDEINRCYYSLREDNGGIIRNESMDGVSITSFNDAVIDICRLNPTLLVKTPIKCDWTRMGVHRDFYV